MIQEISVDKAIKRGHLVVNLPAFISLIGIPGLSLYLSSKELIPKWGIGVGAVLGIVLAWLFWSFIITKWRIWAFDNVRNVHELKKRAIREKLIWRDGNLFEKTEIRTRKDKKLLKEIESKFEIEDIYEEDYSLPSQTIIYYSKSSTFFELFISILMIGVGIYLLSIGSYKKCLLGGALILFGSYNYVKEAHKFHNKNPQVIIDNKGIETISADFNEWTDIEEEEVIQEGYGNSTATYLVYWYDYEKIEKLRIDELAVTRKQLENILRTYRIRHNKETINQVY